LLRDWTRFIRARFIMPRLPRRRRRRRVRRRKIGPGLSCELVAELVAQHAGADFFDFTFGKLTKLERPERDADEPGDS
jgi:hypothetical protein